MRIAMWSGPRNLSTALMYAFASRSDTAVVDEPFYAAYLSATGLNHPMRDEIIKSQSSDPKVVADALVGSIPDNLTHFYQKHMTQHMIPSVPRNWMSGVANVFLIRHPARVVASFSAKYENPAVEDLGFLQQQELFEQVSEMGEKPYVVDSTDIRHDPEKILRRLCDALGLTWNPSMLSWNKGGIPEDGVWASHWYGAVHGSTGFAKAEGDLPILTGRNAELVDATMESYERLSQHKLV